MKNKLFISLLIVFTIFITFLLPFNPRVANDYHHFFKGTLSHIAGRPYTWRNTITTNGLGEYSLSTLWSWPVGYVYGFFDRLGLDYSAFFWLLGIIPFLFFGMWGVGMLFDYFKFSCWGKRVGTLFFLLNTFTLLLLDGGQINLAIAYCLLPLCFVFFIKSVEEWLLVDKVKTALATITLSMFDIRIVYLLVLLIGFYFVFNIFLLKSFRKKTRIVIKFFITGFIVGLAFVAWHAYWILPAMLAKAPSLPVTYERSSQVDFLSFAKLKHSLTLQSPHWYKNVFGKVGEVKAEFVLIPILVLLAPILKRKNKIVAFWLLMALISVFLVKGTNEPLPQIYSWLFLNVPGFSLFRDPTKFFFLVCLSYSMLIGVTTDELVKGFDWKLKMGHLKIYIIPILLIAYYILLADPVWSGKMTGTFSKPIYQDEYFSLANTIQSDRGFGKVFWIPNRAPLGYSSLEHPSVEASRLVSERPFAIGTVGTYETFNFLREAPFMEEIFDIAGISYISYSFPDERKEELKQDNVDYYYTFLDQLTNLDWIEKRISEPPVAVLKTKKNQDHFFISENTWYVAGSDRIYSDLINIRNQGGGKDGFKLSKNALVFAEENPYMGKVLSENSNVNILLYDKSLTDLVATFIDKSKFIFPAQNMDFDPDESGWWKREGTDIIWWKNFLQTKYSIDNQDFDYGGGWAISEADSSELKVKSENFKQGYLLLARLMQSSHGGKVEFWQEEDKIGEIDTKVENPEKVEIKLTGYGEIPDTISEYEKADFYWYELGQLPVSNSQLTIKTQGAINVVNAIAVVSKDEWLYTSELVDWYRNKIIDWDKLTAEQKVKLFEFDGKVNLTYKRINPTHYKVKIEGIDRPVTLAFSETYDPLWTITKLGNEKLSGFQKVPNHNKSQSSYPLYSLINGFYIYEDGEYDVYFSPQKYVLPGLYISLFTLTAIIVILVINSLSRFKKV